MTFVESVSVLAILESVYARSFATGSSKGKVTGVAFRLLLTSGTCIVGLSEVQERVDDDKKNAPIPQK